MPLEIMAFLSFAAIIATLLSSLVAFVALVISDKFIAHGIEAKKLLIISIVALFVAPLAGSLLSSYVLIPLYIHAYLLPLAIWIILGEILLSEDRMTKLKVAAVGWVVYLLLSLTVAPYVFALIPF